MSKKAKKKKRKKINWKKKADDLWSLVVRAHYKQCEICPKRGVLTKSGLLVGGLNAHHVIGRGNIYFRHDLRNGQCLCVGCHRFSQTCGPHAGSIIGVIAYADWMKDNKPEQWAWFEENKFVRKTPKRTYEETYYYLKEILNTGKWPAYDE